MSLLRIGKVSSINFEKGSVVVVFEEHESIVTDSLPLLSYSYDMPEVGDLVACVFLDKDYQRGICLGKYYNQTNLPIKKGNSIWYKSLMDEGDIQYNSKTKTLTIRAENINVEGHVTINGNLTVRGDITASGNVTGSNIE